MNGEFQQDCRLQKKHQYEEFRVDPPIGFKNEVTLVDMLTIPPLASWGTVDLYKWLRVVCERYIRFRLSIVVDRKTSQTCDTISSEQSQRFLKSSTYSME